jgi:putative heme iron utilization protein
MAGTQVSFHNTTAIAVKSRVFETFKTLEFTFTNTDGEEAEFTVYTNDFDLGIEDKGTRGAIRLSE